MSFSLFHRPGSVVMLDDDLSYLEMLGMVLPREWHVALFLQPQVCIDALRQEPELWEADARRQQQIVDRSRDGVPLIPQLLDYWKTSPERHALSLVCVVDYSMPSMDGMQVLGELTHWHGSRVLLTGQADERVAVKAFNQGLIDHFIPKQRPGIAQYLTETIQRLLDHPQARLEQIWRNTLNEQQCNLLSDPSIQLGLAGFAARHWVEYIVMGAPFGVLGLSATGQASWLQLESSSTLPALAELAEAEGLPPEAVREIRVGASLVDLELRQALGHTSLPLLEPAIMIGEGLKLHASLFQIPSEDYPASAPCYERWLARHSERLVRD